MYAGVLASDAASDAERGVFSQATDLPRLPSIHLQAVVLNVGDICGETKEAPQTGETAFGTHEHAASSGLRSASFADTSREEGSASGMDGGFRGHPNQHRYPLLTAEGVWVGEVGPEGTATYVPQVREKVWRCSGSPISTCLSCSYTMGDGVTSCAKFKERCNEYQLLDLSVMVRDRTLTS